MEHYKTAFIAKDMDFLPSGYEPGQCVAIDYAGKLLDRTTGVYRDVYRISKDKVTEQSPMVFACFLEKFCL